MTTKIRAAMAARIGYQNKSSESNDDNENLFCAENGSEQSDDKFGDMDLDLD